MFLELVCSDIDRLIPSSIKDRNFKYKVYRLLLLLSPRFYPVLIYRISYFLGKFHLTLLAKVLTWLNFFIFGIEISSRCSIGRGLLLPHSNGVVIGAWKIGENATIFQGVTLGAKELDFEYSQERRPTVGDNVIIGSGAKILGGVFISNNVVVGANAVVLNNLSSNAIYAGIPAKFIKSNMA